MNDIHIQCVRACWGNLVFDYLHSAAVGNSGGILCVWDSNSFDKESVTLSDSFVLIRGIWRLTGGCHFTWCHKSANKMSKLDRLSVSKSLLNTCSNIAAITLDRYLSNHRPIILCEVYVDYGPTPFKIFHYWFDIEGFNKVVEDAWNDYVGEEANKMSMSVRGVMVDGVWVDDPHKVKKEFLDHLRDLECEVSDEEIKRAVWDCSTEKAPGPDGFTFGFFCRFWYLIHGDVVAAVSPTEEFQFGKGLKQGDPLSPFLFILLMESVHLSFQHFVDAAAMGVLNSIKAVRSRFLNGHVINSKKATWVNWKKALASRERGGL
nr:RNA-directed DNA polymerase, eukaryota [Tanacetum cinerariifolium]